MRKILLTLFLLCMTCSLLITDAQAKRFGGGRSFGVTRNVSSFSRPSSFSPAQNLANKPGNTPNRWLGPLAGFAAGGLLASLFMGHGIGTGIMSWLLITGLIFLAWSFIRNRLQTPAAQVISPSQFQAQQQPFSTAPMQPTNYSFNSQSEMNFDENTFLRQAKSTFIRLQTAFDSKNLADIRVFTTPEVFAEIQMQIQESGSAINQTEVITIEAELLNVSNEAQGTLATVRFSGLIREEEHAEPVAIKELWHFQKDLLKQNWLVAGLQQE